MLMEFLGLSRRSSLENPRVSLHDIEAWNELFGTSETDSGVPMNHDKALSFSPVWQAVSLISGDVAKLPLEVFKRDAGEGRNADKKHPAYKLVRRKANREMSAFRFWRRMMVYALLWNNAYAFIDRNGAGKPLELFPLLPDRTEPKRIGGKLWYITEVDGRLWPIPAYDVLHIEGIAHESLEGADLVEKARNDFALGLAAIKFQSRFFKHGVRTGGILEIPAGTSKAARDKLEEGFSKHHEGPDNWFKTVILRDGAKFHQTSIPPGEAQMIETRKEQRRDVASWFNLPLHKVGLDGNSGYNSLESEKQSYLDSALSHWIETIASECWMKLLSQPEQDSDSHFFEHNTGALVKADVATRYRNYNIGITAGILCPDEARAKENMPPRPDGKGGEYRLPLNMTTGGAKPPKDPPPPDPAPQDPGEDDRVRRLDVVQRRLLVDAVGRMLRRITLHARKAAKAEESYANWLSTDLNGHRSVVADVIGPALEAIALHRGVQIDRAAAVDRFFATVRDALSQRYDQVDAVCSHLDASDVAVADQLLAG